MTEPSLPLARHEIRPEDIDAVCDVLRSPWLALGPVTREFERTLADYVGVRHGIAVSSGTAALHLLIRALGIEPGDEVITTPFSFISSTNCILFERATPVFVDIDPETLCIDPDRVVEAITPRTKAILAVDVFGHPANWTQLERIARESGVALIEDSAEALGSEWLGTRCGSFGCAGIFGFYPNKQITTGEGGMVVTDDDDLAALCRSMTNQGRGDSREWLSHVRLGYNYRIDEMSSALGLSQLRRLDEIVERRARVASEYEAALAPIPDVITPRAQPDVRMSWFVYVVRLPERFSRTDRDDVLAALREKGIDCRAYFSPIHLQPYIRQELDTRPGQFPVTESVGDRAIALPFFPAMTENDVERVVGTLRCIVDGRRLR